MDLHERLRKIEQDLATKAAEIEAAARQKTGEVERRLRETEKTVAGVDTPHGFRPLAAPRMLPRHFRVDISSEQSLAALDDIMEADFELQRYLGASMAEYPTVYCETPREYVEPIIADIPMPDTQREELLHEIEQAAETGRMPSILQSLGVHIPGVGCFINGWYMAREAGVSPTQLLESPDGYAQVVTTASHEKWGHGFISELTALGHEKKSVQLGMHHIADRFSVRTVDTPDHARLSEQWEILFYASNFVEEGFATWIEHYLGRRIASQPLAAPTFTVETITAALQNSPGCAPWIEALTGLFNPPEVSMEAIHEAMNRIGQLANDQETGELFTRAVGLPAPYAVGCAIVDQIARRQGPKCAPYAIATAANLQYGLANISNHDLRNYVDTHPNLNVDTRLALMMFMSEGAQGDVSNFLSRVRDELGLTPPSAGA